MQHLSDKVRSRGYHPIKSRVPLLVSGPVNLFPFQPCDRTPKAELSLFKLDLGYGLQGSLIPFVLHTLVSKRQLPLSYQSSLLFFHAISKDFTPRRYVLNNLPMVTLKNNQLAIRPLFYFSVWSRFLPIHDKERRPIWLLLAIFCLTAAAGTDLAGTKSK
jgi:hypothetical protein